VVVEVKRYKEFSKGFVALFQGFDALFPKVFFQVLYIMDTYTQLFWTFFLLFLISSSYLLCCTKKSDIFYIQIGSGCAMFATSKIGRKFLGLA
jgi:hypothetical protein